MRRPFLLAAFIGILASATLESSAQGTFVFANNQAGLITSNFTTGFDGARATGLKVALYYSTDTNNSNPQSFVLNPNAVTNLLSGALGAGRFSGQTRTVPDAPPGSFILAQIHAWDPHYPTWESAGGVGLCRQYVVKGSSPAFLIGPLGTDALNAALMTNMPAFGVGVSLAPELCEPLLKVLAEPPTFRLRIDLNGSSTFSTLIGIEGSPTLASNSWQVLANFYPTNSPVYWTDPHWTNTSPRFYRVRAYWTGH